MHWGGGIEDSMNLIILDHPGWVEAARHSVMTRLVCWQHWTQYFVYPSGIPFNQLKMNELFISKQKVTSLRKRYSWFEEVWKVKIHRYKNQFQENMITIIRTSNISLVICFEWPLNVIGHLPMKYLFDCSSVHLSGDTWNYTPHYVQFSGFCFSLGNNDHVTWLLFNWKGS